MRRHVPQSRFPRQRDLRRKHGNRAAPAPDANGLITYETYQVVVARRGDTVAQVASRVGLTAAELASFNGRGATDVLREGEVLAMPRRVGPAGGTDIASIARGAIDEADADQPAAAGRRSSPASNPCATASGAARRPIPSRGSTACRSARWPNGTGSAPTSRCARTSI
jgi:lipoprotein NlpD